MSLGALQKSDIEPHNRSHELDWPVAIASCDSELGSLPVVMGVRRRCPSRTIEWKWNNPGDAERSALLKSHSNHLWQRGCRANSNSVRSFGCRERRRAHLVGELERLRVFTHRNHLSCDGTGGDFSFLHNRVYPGDIG